MTSCDFINTTECNNPEEMKAKGIATDGIVKELIYSLTSFRPSFQNVK